uniref:Uncharacterized protein n=1 Tax=Globodera rostochiensis TaxID=31243 RepID=A0A914HYR1_GLORO
MCRAYRRQNCGDHSKDIVSKKKTFSFIFIFILFTSLLIPVVSSNSTAPTWHRHRKHRRSRSFAGFGDLPSDVRHRRLNSAFPTSATPIDFQFTASSYNLTVYENSIGKRAVATNPENAQMVGVWLPRGYNQISFRIVGDKQGRFATSAKRIGNFAFLHLEHRDQMDVLNRELQSEFTFTIRAIAKRKRANTMEASTTIHLRVLDENDNPPMFKELAYRLDIEDDVPLNARLLRVEAFDADEGLNGALYYSLVDPSSYFFIEPTTGWLRNFARLDAGGDIPDEELHLEVQIEDRASRLFRHSQRSDGAESPLPVASIRNKAKVQISIRWKEREKPKLSFQLLPFGPFLSEPTRVGTVRIGHSDPNSIFLDISHRHNAPKVSNCAWLERMQAEEVALWICPPFPEREYGEKLQIRVLIYRIAEKMNGQQREQIGEEILEVWADPSKRKFWLEKAPKIIDINESLSVGAFVWQFGAAASWPNDRKEILFKLHQQNSTEFPFQLNDRSGQLRIGTPLNFDRMKARLWNITVRAEHKQLIQWESVAHVQLRLRDANNHCPKFDQIPLGHRLELSERQLKPKTPSDSIIWRAKASDDDEGSNGQLVYKMVEEDVREAQGLFSIDPLSGEIRLTGDWSSDVPEERIVRIIAMDRGWPFQLQTQLQFVIQRNPTIDANSSNSHLLPPKTEWLQNVCQMDNKYPPKFVGDRSILGEISETAPIGTTVGTVMAEDGDIFGPNGFVQYFKDDHAEEHFEVEPLTGRLFVRSSRLGELLEDTKERNGQDYYDYVLDIVASDMAIRAEDRKTARQQFRVRIRDANTHSPVFDQPGYRISLAEGNSPGIELLQLRATDADLGRNGRVEFRLAVETDLLSVDPDSGLVRAERTLDREELGDYVTVLVMALDRGTPSRATFANLTIFLTDVNDESPQCGRDLHRFSIPEDAPNGQLVGCLDAFDLDEHGTLNSLVRFDLAQPDAKVPFRVHAESGCIFLKLTELPLDFEQLSTYNFSIRLKDMGKPSLEAKEHCQVQILLEDVDENVFPPQFSDMALEASVEENAPVGTEVLRVHAEDPEGTKIRYRLVAGNGYGCFQLDSQSGLISTTKELDHELHQLYWLTVRAEDTPFNANGGRVLHDHLQVLVRVLNQNDRLPLFSQPLYRVAIAENAEENKVVLKVEATDADEQWAKPNQQNDRLKFSILRGNPQTHFQIDEHTGYIVTGKRRLDREAQTEHELIVQACDQGQLCSTATVLVTVNDLNDNAPVFDARNFGQMAIPADRQGIVGRVFASDPDIIGSKLRLWMDSGDERIQMDEKGRLFAREALNPGTELEAVIWVEDGAVPPLRANATLRLVALGRVGRLRTSNRAPHLLEGGEWRQIEMSEDDPTGTVVGVVRAEDPDRDPLWWTIISTTPEGEQIDQLQGQEKEEPFAFRRVEEGAELVVAERLPTADKHRLTQHLVVRFSVSDGVDTINDQIHVRIRQNSHGKLRPQFEQSEAIVELGNNLPVGFVLHQAKAGMKLFENSEDLSHPRRRLQYSLHSSDDLAASEVFRVDPGTGNVLLERPLPERLASPFTLTISASLFGSADATDFAILRMKRKAENEKPPQFVSCDGEQRQKILQIDENFAAGALIYAFEAVDPDSGEFGKVLFSLHSGNEQRLFTLNATTGQLKLAKAVPRNLNEIILTIRATDAPLPGQRAKWRGGGKMAELTFGGPRPSERKSAAVEIFSGPIINLLSSSAFFTLNGCSQSLAIHFATGRIILKRNTIMEEMTLNCTVELKKSTINGDQLLLDGIPLIVRFLPSLPIRPRFDRNEIFGTISENCRSGSPVLLPNGSAPLSPSLLNRFPPKSVKFRLLSPLDSHFMIDAHLGIIRCVAPIDAEQFLKWHFFVLAQQSLPSNAVGPLSFSQPLLVHITINDTNDESPVFGTNPVDFQVIMPSVKGSTIGRVIATDHDSDQLKYSFKVPSTVFAIDESLGIIKSLANDSDILKIHQNPILLEATVSDGLYSSDSVSIRLKITNSSSLPLHFSRPVYNLNIRENQTERRLVLSLWPPQIGLGESIHFELVALEGTEWPKAFELEESVGLLWLDTKHCKLDRELTPNFRFLLRGANGKEILAQSLVNVQLEDVNDCPPEFSQAEYTASISEAAKTGDRIISVRARDNDTAMNALVRYSLLEDAPKFVELNKYDGKLSVSATISSHRLAIGDSFRFRVRATDRGVPPLSAESVVTLRVVHRRQPIFSQQIYTAQINAKTNFNNPLVTVRAWSSTASDDSQIGYILLRGDERRHFRMDFVKGQLRLSAEPAFELELYEFEYNLTVEATDITLRRCPPAHAQIHVQVHRSEAARIRFAQHNFRWKVPENAQINAQLGVLIDQQPKLKTESAAAIVRLMNWGIEAFEWPISVTENGIVRVKEQFDFELCPFLQFGAELSRVNGNGLEAVLMDKALVQLELSDVNDNVPEFAGNGPAKLLIWCRPNNSEAMPKTKNEHFIHKFDVNDLDATANNKFEFRLVEDNAKLPVPLSLFRLDSSSGVLSVDCDAFPSHWHFPTRQPFTLNISVSDGIHYAYTGANLQLLGADSDSLLCFERSLYSSRISLAQSTGMPLGIIRARGGNPPYKFGIGGKLLVSSSTAESAWPIEVDGESGRIILRKTAVMPWQSKPSIPVPLLVEDAAGDKAFSLFQLLPPEPGDVNVHSPRWIAPEGGYKFWLDLGAVRSGERIFQVLAVDGDENDRLEYQMTANSEAEHLFHLNSTTGVLSLGKIDKKFTTDEQQQRTVSFAIQASDTGNPPHKSEIALQIRILLPSSKAPPFSRAPRFSQLRHSFALPEDTPPTQFLGQLRVDNGSDGIGDGQSAIFGGNVRFSIVEGSDPADSVPFLLHPQTGQLSLRHRLDAEQRLSHHFVVRVERPQQNGADGVSLLSSLSLVSVSVMDVNDMAPEFVSVPPENPIVVREDLVPGTVIASLVAWDADVEEANSAIVYSLDTGGDDPDAQVGPGGIDRERRGQYILRAIATDSGGLQAVQNIQIRVADLNDCPPRFDRSLYKLDLKLDSDTTLNDTLLHFGVSDPDEFDGKLRVILLDDRLGLFSVKQGHNLTLARIPSVRRESDAIPRPYTVNIVAFDGINSDYAQLEANIELNFLEMESPRICVDGLFEAQALKISGNLPPGHPIFEWSHENVSRVELFGASDIENAFQIRNYSSLVVLANYHQRIRYDVKLLIAGPQNSHFFGCKKSVEEFGCVQTLHVLVENANKMAPQFLSPQLQLNVSENAFKRPPPKDDFQTLLVLARLEAFDLDWGQFGQLSYSLFGENAAEMPFFVDPQTGVFSLSGQLDREERDRWEVPVRAEDGGGLAGHLTVLVHVQDENDNAPECAKPLYQAQVLENDPNGVDIQLEAHDQDVLRHPDGFLFKLSEETPADLAQMLQISPAGRIQLKANISLDFEYWKSVKGPQMRGTAVLLEFGVEVHDRGEPISLKGFCRVQIALLDVNDNAPAFEQSFYEVEVRENAPNGTKILKLFAEDADSEHFGRVSYSLDSIKLMGNKTDQNELYLGGSDLADHFVLGDQDGWLKIGTPLDFERIGKDRFVQLIIRARDGGEPPLQNHTTVQVNVRDENDNSPRIGDCSKLSALIQEGIASGHTVLFLSVTDGDSAEGNAGPFRVELSGNGADSFAVDSLLNLITTRRLESSQKQEFHFDIRAFDVGGLGSDPCRVRIRVQPQSRHAPEIRPLSVQLMALHGEFLGGPLGKLTATDRDVTDQLRFAISDQKQLQFSVNPENGELFASGDLLPGILRLNVSVTDGKFVTNAPVIVNVIKVDQEKMDNSLTIRLRGFGAEHFVSSFMQRFTDLVARLLSTKPNSVFILSLQEIRHLIPQNEIKLPENGRHHALRRSRDKNIGGNATTPTNLTANSLLDIILVIQRPDGAPGGMLYYRPSYVKQRLDGIGRLVEKEAPELKVVSIINELCRRDTCARGDCRDRLWMDNSNVRTVQSAGSSAVFIGPVHVRTFECICRQGYVGANCDIPANKCSKELCKRVELCIPSAHSPYLPRNNIGFACACSPGFRGTACSERICTSDSTSASECHRHHEAISLLGNGYFELRVAVSVESRMELSVNFRTVSSRAVLMFGKGLNDHQTLRIEDGMIQYSWNCGTGEGIVKIGAVRVDNGQWHQIRILRIGRLSRLTLDDKFRAEGTSPAGSDVLNLFVHATLILFGARVEPSATSQRQFFEAFTVNGTAINKMELAEDDDGKLPLTADDLRVQLSDGMVGCVGHISMDGTALPKAGPGFRLFNAAIGCDERALGPCLSAPCQNGGQCIPSASFSSSGDNPTTKNRSSAFNCNCPQRFTGARCEIDLNACASKPCPNGIPCHNLYGDFHCSCPPGFTGKTCQLRGDWDPCVTASCGQNGQCVRQQQSNSFFCQCFNAFTGPLCTEPVPTEMASDEAEEGGGSFDGAGFLWEMVETPQFVLLLAVCLLTLLCTLGVIFCRMKRQNIDGRGGQNRRTKISKGRGEGEGRPKNGTAPTATQHSIGSTTASRSCRRGEDPASNPLVPRETAAPGQGTSDRPPPPLPPRYHRRNANGQNSALPTVEVRPMPIGEQINIANETMERIESTKTPPLPPSRDSSERHKSGVIKSLSSPKAQPNEQNGQRRQSGSGSYGRKIDRACSAAADTQKQKMTSSKKATVNKTPGGGRSANAKDEGKLVSKTSREGVNAPPPPLHRTPLLNTRGHGERRNSGNLLYDSPTDALEEENGVEEEERMEWKRKREWSGVEEEERMEWSGRGRENGVEWKRKRSIRLDKNGTMPHDFAHRSKTSWLNNPPKTLISSHG